jgi:hypothetical protein
MKFLVLWSDYDGNPGAEGPTNFGEQKPPRLFFSEEAMTAWVDCDLSVDDHDWMVFTVHVDGSTALWQKQV